MSPSPALSETAQKEKDWAAMSSVAAAAALTLFKIITGIVTGSLGIVAEAAHSGLDLVAALMTAFAVKISSKPADRSHLYGHGKIENLSALFETLLLLATCFWIISTAISHIVNRQVVILVNFWSFFVMGISIVVDVSRSRMLYRTAKKYNSQALEADALHFSTDIWSSAVVILGLICVKLSEWFRGYEFLKYADTVAAIIVGLIVIQISFKLGIRTIQALLDSAPAGLDKKVAQIVEALPGVINCHDIRIRTSGPYIFIDLHVTMDGGQTLKQAHNLTDQIEQVIQKVLPGADVTAHAEPT